MLSTNILSIQTKILAKPLFDHIRHPFVVNGWYIQEWRDQKFGLGINPFIPKCIVPARLLPVTYQIDIRTANFLENYISSDNSRLYVGYGI